MKNIQLILFMIVLSTVNMVAQGDTHTLKILRDDPNAVSDHIIGINGCHAQFSKTEGLKAGLGTEVLWSMGPKLQIQSNFMFYYLCIRNAQGPDYSLEGGAAYNIGSRTKTKEMKIILSYSETKSHTATTTTTTKEVKYLVSSGTVLSKTNVRAGAYFKQGGMDQTPDEISPSVVKYTGVGIYGGIEFTQQACLFSEVDGEKGVTSGLTRIYIDGIFLPVSKFENGGTDPGNLGFRFGFATYFNPNKKKNPEYGKLTPYQVYPSLFFKTEAGIRGGEGWFFNLGLGFMIHRNK